MLMSGRIGARGSDALKEDLEKTQVAVAKIHELF